MLELNIESCVQHEIERLTEILENAGALSVSMMDQYDAPILEPAPGETPLWEHLIVQALFEDMNSIQEVQAEIQRVFPHLTQVIKTLPDQDWERTCLDRFTPIQCGKRLWICPSWLTPPHEETVNLILDPGLAFGTGSHPTTSLCLSWLDSASLSDKSIIDYGCGSGILALAALKLGAKIAYAVDIDPQALTATQQNAEINEISHTQLIICKPEALTTPVDIILANILLTPLLNLGKTFHQLLKPNGELVISGVFLTQVPQLIEAYQNDFVHFITTEKEEWAMVIFRKK